MPSLLRVLGYDAAMDPHRLGELRSIAYHREIGRRLQANPEVIERARQRIGRLRRRGLRAGPPAEAWLGWLELPPTELARRLVEDTDDARELRQSSPFVGVLSASERWRIHREIGAGAVP